jgi:hypothetical protein
MKRSGKAVSFIPTALLAGLLLNPHGKVLTTMLDLSCPFVGLERTKPHVFCQEKWPAGPYTTRVASGRALLC